MRFSTMKLAVAWSFLRRNGFYPILMIGGAWLPLLVQAKTLESFDRAISGKLFTLQGSNTIGASLAPTWAKQYLEAKGVNGVFIEPLAGENACRVKGRNGTRHGHTTGS